MTILAITAVVHDSNIKRAVQYYQDVLGFKPGFEFGDFGPARSVKYGPAPHKCSISTDIPSRQSRNLK
jgi:catechol 2,3-dioxygenase-like lactoylglutathione lyase family enzyme